METGVHARVWSHYRFALPFIGFIPDSLRDSAPLSETTMRPNPTCMCTVIYGEQIR
jgi:hypothetical protein